MSKIFTMNEINKIYNEDCVDTMSRMPDNFIDLTVTSPPYEDLRIYTGFDFDFEQTAIQLFRITKIGGIVIWVVGDKTHKGSESGNSFKQALFFKNIGFNLHDTMIYAKKNFIPQNNKRYEQEFEFIFVFTKGKIKTFNPLLQKTKLGGTSINLKRKGYSRQLKGASQRRRDETIIIKDFKVPGNIFTYGIGNSGKNHPAVFPFQLAHDMVFSWSNEGDLVYDPFIGSGTTRDACVALKRNWIGSEISKEYYNQL